MILAVNIHNDYINVAKIYTVVGRVVGSFSL